MSTNFVSSRFILGILGGGQLGKMLLAEASRLDIQTSVLDPSADAPCARRSDQFQVGDLMDEETVLAFGRNCDLLTIEIEAVNVDAMERLEKEGIKVYPPASLLRVIKHKGLQKDFYRDHQIPTLPYFRYESLAELRSHPLNYPAVLKVASGGYDGRGVMILHQSADLANVPDAPGIVEPMLVDKKEISILVARNPSGEKACYQAVEMLFNPTANLVEFLFSPAELSATLAEAAKQLAWRVADAFGLVGIMAVEMFVTPAGEILVNECSPRPHNSGHHTIEACITSQHEQHLRAILDLPLGSTEQLRPAVMVNILGGKRPGEPLYQGFREVLALKGVYVHVYGKKETRPFRKMGHVTVIDEDLEQAKAKAEKVLELLKVGE